jgi:3-methyladenine DNA glycosylase/8-oxoguanine DNA glycosylase
MADERDVTPSAAKDPDDWTTGDEPMTGPQQSYLHTLAQQAGEEPPRDDLSKADASKAIEDLQAKSGRGR